ncbi:MAG: hypothetical protein HQK89_15755 [Nitrospirae bacterium]|nr:hypothetical protein [Nitrospirota bacterium]
MSESRFKEKPLCSVKVPVPSLEACHSCGYENEVWSDEEEPVCRQCNTLLKQNDTPPKGKPANQADI